MKIIQITSILNHKSSYFVEKENEICFINVAPRVAHYDDFVLLIQDLYCGGIYLTMYYKNDEWVQRYNFETVIVFNSINELFELYPEYMI